MRNSLALVAVVTAAVLATSCGAPVPGPAVTQPRAVKRLRHHPSRPRPQDQSGRRLESGSTRFRWSRRRQAGPRCRLRTLTTTRRSSSAARLMADAPGRWSLPRRPRPRLRRTTWCSKRSTRAARGWWPRRPKTRGHDSRVPHRRQRPVMAAVCAHRRQSACRHRRHRAPRLAAGEPRRGHGTAIQSGSTGPRRRPALVTAGPLAGVRSSPRPTAPTRPAVELRQGRDRVQLGQDRVDRGPGATLATRVLVTRDGGAHWASQQLPIPPSACAAGRLRGVRAAVRRTHHVPAYGRLSRQRRSCSSVQTRAVAGGRAIMPRGAEFVSAGPVLQPVRRDRRVGRVAGRSWAARSI